jgi:hypothetical protein
MRGPYSPGLDSAGSDQAGPDQYCGAIISVLLYAGLKKSDTDNNMTSRLGLYIN